MKIHPTTDPSQGFDFPINFLWRTLPPISNPALIMIARTKKIEIPECFPEYNSVQITLSCHSSKVDPNKIKGIAPMNAPDNIMTVIKLFASVIFS